MKKKRCPFCGNAARWWPEDRAAGVWIGCSVCCISQCGVFSSREAAIDHWNRRQGVGLWRKNKDANELKWRG